MPFYTKTLLDALKEKRQSGLYFTEMHIAEIFDQIVDGLQHIHNKNLLHRDLKLENVMLDNNNQVKIVDYNSLKNAESQRGKNSVCTVLYAAPEVFEGSSLTEQTDVFALGVMLFEFISLITARDISSRSYFKLSTLDDENTVHGTMSAAMKKNPNAISTLLKRLVFSIIRHDPKKRPTLPNVKKVLSIIIHGEQESRKQLIEQFGLKEMVEPVFFGTDVLVNQRKNGAPAPVNSGQKQPEKQPSAPQGQQPQQPLQSNSQKAPSVSPSNSSSSRSSSSSSSSTRKHIYISNQYTSETRRVVISNLDNLSYSTLRESITKSFGEASTSLQLKQIVPSRNMSISISNDSDMEGLVDDLLNDPESVSLVLEKPSTSGTVSSTIKSNE